MNKYRLFILLAVFLGAVSCVRQAEIIVSNTGEAPNILLRHTVPVGRLNPGVLRDTLSGTNEIRFRIEARHPVFISLQDVRKPENFCELPRLAKKSFDNLSPREEWFHLLKNIRNFALNEKGIPTRMQKVLDASRSNALLNNNRRFPKGGRQLLFPEDVLRRLICIRA